MSVNEQFVTACNRLEEARVEDLYVNYKHLPGLSPSIEVATNSNTTGLNTDIRDKEMNVAGWRRYGKSIKTNNTVKYFSCSGGRDGFSPEAAQCLQVFFEELKENTSIEKITFSHAFSTAISALDLRYFFQNNLRRISLHDYGHSITLAQSAHLSAALRDIDFEDILITCGHGIFSNEAFEQLLSACRKVKMLTLLELKENDLFTTVATMLQDPNVSIKCIALFCGNSNNFDVERAEDELLAGLTQNSNMKVLRVSNLFKEDAARACTKIKNMLCNTTSLESVRQSNHTLEKINSGHFENELQANKYLELNKIFNKRKVVQTKLMKYYFSRHVDVLSQDQTTNPIRPIANMPHGLLAEILGIDVPGKQSAVFNILKCIPELCDVSGRNRMQSERSCDADGGSDKKRQKIDL